VGELSGCQAAILYGCAVDDYLDELDALLLYLGDEGLLLSELDGFLTGVIVSPDLVPPSDWVARVWGGGTPPFETADELQRFVDLVMHHYNELITSLGSPAGFEPLFDTDDRNGDLLWELWIDGFAAAMKLAPRGWNRLRASDDAAGKMALAGIMRLAAIADRDVKLPEDQQQNCDREAPAQITIWAGMLHEWRLDNDGNRPAGKVGRNDRCPCGSGEKYKKCCGLNRLPRPWGEQARSSLAPWERPREATATHHRTNRTDTPSRSHGRTPPAWRRAPSAR
jgi:uncharacterized protein